MVLLSDKKKKDMWEAFFRVFWAERWDEQLGLG